MHTQPCRLIPGGKMKENAKTHLCLCGCTDLLFCLSFALHVLRCFPLFLSVFFPLFGSDSGFFFRVLGWHQTCMLDERRDPLEVFSKAVHLPKGLEHQPVLPYHHPASGTWININTNNRCLILKDPHIFSLILSSTSQMYIQQITDIDGMLDCFRFGVSSSVNGMVIGATVMEGFYVVFDRAQRRLGFALSNCAGKCTFQTAIFSSKIEWGLLFTSATEGTRHLYKADLY